MQNVPLQTIQDRALSAAGLQLDILREDLLHPEISGNKWRKLLYNIQAAKAANQTTLLTYGGAYSNHIAATAAAAGTYGFRSIGIIRGEAALPLNPTLALAQRKGMVLKFISRAAYREKENAAFTLSLKEAFGDFYEIPEGGANVAGIKGCQQIALNIPAAASHVAVAMGTASTAAGLVSAPDKSYITLGFSSLKGDFMEEQLQKHFQSIATSANTCAYKLFGQYHFGGYAKHRPALIDFINNFKQQHQIQLDPVYTGKMMYGLFDLIKSGYFRRGDYIVAVHTGGLQGIAGFNERFGNLIKT